MVSVDLAKAVCSGMSRYGWLLFPLAEDLSGSRVETASSRAEVGSNFSGPSGPSWDEICDMMHLSAALTRILSSYT